MVRPPVAPKCVTVKQTEGALWEVICMPELFSTLRPGGRAVFTSLRSAPFASLTPLRFLRSAPFASLTPLRFLRSAPFASLTPLRSPPLRSATHRNTLLRHLVPRQAPQQYYSASLRSAPTHPPCLNVFPYGKTVRNSVNNLH